MWYMKELATDASTDNSKISFDGWQVRKRILKDSKKNLGKMLECSKIQFINCDDMSIQELTEEISDLLFNEKRSGCNE